MVKNLPRWATVPMNTYGFIGVPLLIALVLAIGGYTPVKIILILVLCLGELVLWVTSHARQTPNVPETSEALFDKITKSKKYALVAFESEFCLASTTVGQSLTKIEEEYPGHFELYSVSVLQEPGKALFDQFNGRVTPTYVLVDPNGKLVDDWPLVLPVERVRYAISQRAAHDLLTPR